MTAAFPVPLENLIVPATKEEIYETAIGIGESIGVPVSTWQPGDPTRSLYYIEAEKLATREELEVNFIKAKFLDLAAELAREGLAKGDTGAMVWLRIRAQQDFGVEVPEATFATTTVELTNQSGAFYEFEANELSFRNSLTGKTYHNTTGGTLESGIGKTLELEVEADEAGSASSAGEGEIDEIVTTLEGPVDVTNEIAAVGSDEQDPDTTVQQCRDKLGALSPNGPREAYAYVARNPDLTGTSAITDARVYPYSDTGDVTVYLRSASGGVGETDRQLVEDAILTWATPLCITPTVLSATPVAVDITYSLWLYKSVNKTATEVEEAVEAALEAMFAKRPIGGDIIPPATSGKLYLEKIKATIGEVFSQQTFRSSVSLPAGDTDLDNNEVPTVGTVTATIIFVNDP